MQALKLYGIPNCNTVKKSREWLDSHHVVYEFHDFKKQGASKQLLESWLTQIPHEKLVNRAGLTWRGLNEVTKASITDNTSAIALMQEKASVIKRPILVKNDIVLCLGFDEATYKELFT
jgi:arsenate reductase (glutaredoxin)